MNHDDFHTTHWSVVLTAKGDDTAAKAALAMIQRAIQTLDHEQEHHLLPWITREMTGETRRQLAAELGMSDTAIKTALHRLRKKFRETIRTQIAETVKDASEIDAELDHLLWALQG